MTGEDTELDRTVVDQIGDPLQHLLRNSADHGLEDNETRVALGKPEVGSIFLNAFQEGNNVIIQVGDDGAVSMWLQYVIKRLREELSQKNRLRA